MGTPSSPSWGQWGPIGSKKWVKTVKNYHAPKFEFSINPRSSFFRKKWKLKLWRQITVGTPSSPSWGQWGPIGSKKWVKTVKNYHAPKFEFSINPRSSFFRKKWKLRLWRQITLGTPLGSILGPMGSHWVQKMCQNRKKLPCPKIRIFDYPSVIDFSQKWKLRLWHQITVGTP